MATTTTNFGWDIPQSTDLVKDGATAIAALGQDIDTAFIDLKGGTTGQVLSKASGTDLDFTWVAQDDSNAIQNAIVDAKGDLIAATAADTPARLGVGTNGQVLTADSTAATGLAWATPSSGSTFSGALVYKSGTESTTAGDTWQTVTFNSEVHDTNSYHSTSTNTSRLTIPTTGYYQIFAEAVFYTASSTGYRSMRFRRNNGAFSPDILAGDLLQTGSTRTGLTMLATWNLTAGDYIELQLFSQSQDATINHTQLFFGIQSLGA